ncbi:TMV resistance protein N-like [Solanum tuberosum]|uniref:TMV resistance protein N-like n=1 Tax=Solanum tuberosum TaxID=4113 RepID=UPI00073A12D6|nr:PREDICTED: TMV resistance protein N-like [Solanum tuberosum]
MPCFFRGYRKNRVMQILESCDFEAEYGLDVLIDKSLVFIFETDTIEMHDLMQDMGRYVVKLQKDSGEPSRLWNAKDFNEVMVNNTGTMAMEVIWFTYFEQIYLNKEAMENMKKLRILYLDDGRPHRLASPPSDIDSKHIPNGSIECLSNNLRWVFWKHYPWESLSEKFKPQRLVHLNLSRSLLHDLWTKRKILSCNCEFFPSPSHHQVHNIYDSHIIGIMLSHEEGKHLLGQFTRNIFSLLRCISLGNIENLYCLRSIN